MQIRKMSLMLAAAMLLSPFSLALAEQPPVEPDAPSEAVSEPVEEAVSEAVDADIEEIGQISLGEDGAIALDDGDELPSFDLSLEGIEPTETEPEADDVPEEVEANDGEFSGYALVNIPSNQFFGAIDAGTSDVDAVTSATDKVGNYGIAGGAYHTKATYGGQDADDKPIAVGGQNGAKLEGVIWAVKADSLADLQALGGDEITDASTLTVATSAHGNASKTDLAGYECLMEAPDYSYYVLAEAPDNYLALEGGSFKSGAVKAESKGETAPSDLASIYNGHHAEMEMGLTAYPENVLINAAVVTTESGNTAMVPLYQVWRGGMQIGGISVSGQKLTKLTFYCSTKGGSGTAPASYANHVYEYTMDAAIPAKYNGELTAAFNGPKSLTLNGLPKDAVNLKAIVSYSAGRGSEPVYLTDKAGNAVSRNAVSLDSAAEEGKTYTVLLSSDNYGFKSVSATYAQTVIQVPKNVKETVYLGTVYRIDTVNRTLTDCKSLTKKTVSVTSDGVITPIKAGTARIRIFTQEGKKLTLTLKIVDPTIPTKVSFQEGKKRTVTVGETLTLTPVILPETAVQDVTWKSSNKKVASVVDGVVTTYKKGSATITVKTVNGKKATFRITVKKAK